MKLIQILEDGTLQIDPSLYLYKEFRGLQNKTFLTEKGNGRGLKSLQTSHIPKHIRVLKYLYLIYDPKMVLENEHLTEYERKLDAREQCDLEEEIYKDKLFIAAENKFKEISQTLELLALESTINGLHNVISANKVIGQRMNDLLKEEELSTGEMSNIIDLMKNSLDLGIKTEKTLTAFVKAKEKYRKELIEDIGVRGDQEDGLDFLID